MNLPRENASKLLSKRLKQVLDTCSNFITITPLYSRNLFYLTSGRVVGKLLGLRLDGLKQQEYATFTFNSTCQKRA